MFRHPFSIIGGVLIGALYLIAITLLPKPGMGFVNVGWPLRLSILAMAPVSIGMISCLPHLPARWFPQFSSFPYHTYLLPRWIICLISTNLLGSSMSQLLASLFSYPLAFEMAALHLSCWMAFGYSASLRCKKPQSVEYSVPWRPRSLLRFK